MFSVGCWLLDCLLLGSGLTRTARGECMHSSLGSRCWPHIHTYTHTHVYGECIHICLKGTERQSLHTVRVMSIKPSFTMMTYTQFSGCFWLAEVLLTESSSQTTQTCCYRTFVVVNYTHTPSLEYASAKESMLSYTPSHIYIQFWPSLLLVILKSLSPQTVIFPRSLTGKWNSIHRMILYILNKPFG